MSEEIDLIADDEQIRRMNEEYKKLGIVADDAEDRQKAASTDGENDGKMSEKVKITTAAPESSMIKKPYPIYMQSECMRYCELSELAGEIIKNLDRRFFAENRDYLEYIYTLEDKNGIYVRSLGNITCDIRSQSAPMPLKQALRALLNTATNQLLLLDKILGYDKSEHSKEIRLNQLGIAACIQSLIVLAF